MDRRNPLKESREDRLGMKEGSDAMKRLRHAVTKQHTPHRWVPTLRWLTNSTTFLLALSRETDCPLRSQPEGRTHPPGRSVT